MTGKKELREIESLVVRAGDIMRRLPEPSPRRQGILEGSEKESTRFDTTQSEPRHVESQDKGSPQRTGE